MKNAKVIVKAYRGPRTGLSLLYEGVEIELARLGYHTSPSYAEGTCAFIAGLSGKYGLMRPIMPRKDRWVFALTGWCSDSLAWPEAYSRRLIPWIFDCWEPGFERCAAMLKRHKTKLAFFSSQDALGSISKLVPDLRAVWCPEACDPYLYDARIPLQDREIGIFEMGRRHERFHRALVDHSSCYPRPHLYQGSNERPGKRTGSFQDLCGVLSKSAIVVCFPKCMTHPREAGNVCTMTQRYLEAMASGCIIVGQSPRELVELFGFDPAIPVQWPDVGAQVEHMLRNLDQFQAHTNRCLRRLWQVGTFAARANLIDTEISRLKWSSLSCP